MNNIKSILSLAFLMGTQSVTTESMASQSSFDKNNQIEESISLSGSSQEDDIRIAPRMKLCNKGDSTVAVSFSHEMSSENSKIQNILEGGKKWFLIEPKKEITFIRETKKPVSSEETLDPEISGQKLFEIRVCDYDTENSQPISNTENKLTFSNTMEIFGEEGSPNSYARVYDLASDVLVGIQHRDWGYKGGHSLITLYDPYHDFSGNEKTFLVGLRG